MNILRNFEAVFVVALGLASAASYTLDSSVEPTPAYAAASNMQVVVVSAKRLSPEQKQAMQEQEHPATLAAQTRTASKI